jgi:hypothetical protein
MHFGVSALAAIPAGRISSACLSALSFSVLRVSVAILSQLRISSAQDDQFSGQLFLGRCRGLPPAPFQH